MNTYELSYASIKYEIKDINQGRIASLWLSMNEAGEVTSMSMTPHSASFKDKEIFKQLLAIIYKLTFEKKLPNLTVSTAITIDASDDILI